LKLDRIGSILKENWKQIAKATFVKKERSLKVYWQR
jgi:hypothetical protein